MHASGADGGGLPPMTAVTAMVAGRYRLDESVGSADLGVVWHAYDELLQREVAVREGRVPDGIDEADRERMAERTLAGARAVAAIDTPAAVRVFDIVEYDGRPWIVTELVRGRTLTEVLAEEVPLPSGEVGRIGLCLLEALEVAHRVGVLHRDVKPSNVIVGPDGRIALNGFGIVTDDEQDTSDVVVGSPSYLAPERARGEAPTPAGDLWAMAATLWTAAEGRPPYDGATPDDVLAAITDGPPPPCVHCVRPLADVLIALMAPAPGDRPEPAAVREALEEVCRESRLQAAQAEPFDPYPSSGRVRKAFDRTTVVASRPQEAERTWPLLVAFLVMLLATAAALSALMQSGPH